MAPCLFFPPGVPISSAEQDVLKYFGEDPKMTPQAFFTTLESFMRVFEQAKDDLERKERAKERERLLAEKKALASPLNTSLNGSNTRKKSASAGVAKEEEGGDSTGGGQSVAPMAPQDGGGKGKAGGTVGGEGDPARRRQASAGMSLGGEEGGKESKFARSLTWETPGSVDVRGRGESTEGGGEGGEDGPRSPNKPPKPAVRKAGSVPDAFPL
ncbi:Actin-binding FH2 [Nannochloropsis gaditana]|uniref:Actin-binding FH2 n=1 Tax=Nannochloropsis gaditana TaxID=72520 RepID=W7TV08_9STRA|nr:Actin-binding FH2 [Nannochloropsis gaditana]